MSREIRFRAFDSILGEMLELRPNRDMFYLNDGPGWNVMQYTGLKDKNGNPIYESDIINVFDWGGAGEILGVTSVVWDLDDHGWSYENTSLTEDSYDQFRNVEVIGNIWESPELLEDKE